jgi:polar amino acid transport system substrate-binding protein
MRSILLSAILLIATSVPGGLSAQPATTSEIAPLGKLRVGTQAGNPMFVKRGPDGKVIGGLSVSVGRFIAEKLGVPFELVPYSDPNTFLQSFGKGEWDVGIGPPTALAAEKADFGPDLLLLDHVYVAAPGQEFADAAQVDRPGVMVGTGRDSAQDQFLSRTLKSAELVRMRVGGLDAIDALRSGKAHLWATNATIAETIIAGLPGAKIVPGAFNKERSSVMLPKGRSPAAQGKVAEIANEAKRTGIVQKAIEQGGLRGVQVAPN